MKLDVPQPKFNLCLYPLTDGMRLERDEWERSLQPGMWVKLLELPSPFSFDEALLLCQSEGSQWIVWIPDCGEAAIDTRQFGPLDVLGKDN